MIILLGARGAKLPMHRHVSIFYQGLGGRAKPHDNFIRG